MHKIALVYIIGCQLGLAWTLDLRAAAAEQVWVRWHYVGTEKIKTAEAAATLNSVLELPESRRLATEMTERLALMPDRWVFGKDANASAARTRLITPVLETCLSSESFGEVGGLPDGRPCLNLTVRLDADLAGKWNESWTRLARTYGWEISNDSDGNEHQWTAASVDPGFLLRSTRVGDWSIISIGADAFSQMLDWSRRLASEHSPFNADANAWLETDLNLELLISRWLDCDTVPVRRLELSFSPREDSIRTEGSIELTTPIDLELKPWNVPTDVIQDPIISFSALRGAEALLEAFSGGEPTSEHGMSHLYCWARPFSVKDGFTAFRTYAAWPGEISPEHVRSLADQAPDFIGAPLYIEPDNRVVFQIFPPFVQPLLRGLKTEQGDFLLAGLFPRSPVTNPPPPELVAQMNHPDLLYYQWEITQQRQEIWRLLFQLAAFLYGKEQMADEAVTMAWLDAIEAKLGNSVTQIRAASSNELRVLRRSHIGLTGLEIALLAWWLDSESFPEIDLEKLLTWEMAFKRKTEPVAPESSDGESSDAETGSQH